MGLGGLAGDIYRPLSKDQVETIHERALDLLEECGMTYEEGLEDVLSVLKNAGCKIDTEQNRIYFPCGLVEEMVIRAPGEFVLYSRNGEK